jgi:hypothetical protein
VPVWSDASELVRQSAHSTDGATRPRSRAVGAASAAASGSGALRMHNPLMVRVVMRPEHVAQPRVPPVLMERW